MVKRKFKGSIFQTLFTLANRIIFIFNRWWVLLSWRTTLQELYETFIPWWKNTNSIESSRGLEVTERLLWWYSIQNWNKSNYGTRYHFTLEGPIWWSLLSKSTLLFSKAVALLFRTWLDQIISFLVTKCSNNSNRLYTVRHSYLYTLIIRFYTKSVKIWTPHRVCWVGVKWIAVNVHLWIFLLHGKYLWEMEHRCF